MEIKIYKTITVRVVLCGCEALHVTLRTLRREYSELRGKKRQEDGEECIMRFTTCTLHQILFR
jgi:hypothetical protein